MWISDQLDEPAEKKQKKESKKNGRRLSKEERYMMGEEDDYEEDPDFRDNASEDPDAEEYLPEAADDADAQLDEMKKELAASVTEKSEHGAEKRGEEPGLQEQIRRTMILKSSIWMMTFKS